MKEGSGIDQTPNGNSFTESGDVLTNTAGERTIWRFNSVSNTGKAVHTDTITLYDLFMVMKVREATFGQTSGVFTGGTATQVLVGSNGTGLFTTATTSEYRLNGALSATLTAPMNEWGVVHLRIPAGVTVINPQIGQDRNVGTSTKAEIDVAETIIFTRSLPMYMVRELTEYLVILKNSLV
jgi:hypothetical protein